MLEFAEIIALTWWKWIVGISVVGCWFYKWATNRKDFFKEKGLPYLPPEFFFGSVRQFVLQTQNLHDVALKLYSYFPNEKICGFFEMRNPLLLMRDPEIIKLMTVKDFDHFLDHRSAADETVDPLFGRGIFALRGSKWRDMRATLSPMFTGSKMRMMFQLVVDCADSTKKHLLAQSKNQEPLVLEMKDLFSRFATDVIASSAFGLEVNSLKDPKNKFYEIGKVVANFGGIRSLISIGYVTFPKMMKFFKITLLPTSIHNLFRALVWDTMKFRDEKNIVRHDIINLLMQVRKGDLTFEKESQPEQGFSVVQESEVGLATHKRVWEDDDLTAQCFSFFLGGFDTSSTLLSFATHELAINKDIQQKLIDEVDHYKEILDGKPLTYEMLSKMTYLDMVISETLRKWPPVVVTNRKCTKPYVLKYDNKEVEIKAGDVLWLPIYAIQMDEKYFKDPQRFDPERFNGENKKNIQQNTFIPFGVGPRNCIGSRFALMESKAILFYLLTEFTFEVSEKTQIPLKMANCGFQVKSEKGFWIHLRPRN